MKLIGTFRMVLIASFLFLILAQSVWSVDQGFETRPIPLGTSGGNIKDSSRSFCCGGTLGSLVQDTSAVQYILSNNHVLGRTNKGIVGEAIIQPALIDQDPVCFKDAGDAVSHLSDFVPLSFRRNTVNHVDAAIAEVQVGQVDPSGSIINIGEVSNVIAAPILGMAVKKVGRTTGLTTGTVTALDVTADIQYDKHCGVSLFPQTARFTGQIMITPGTFSMGGDSGSLIVEDCSPHPRPVGLLFAGSGTNTIANPLSDVLSELGVSMVGRNDFCSTSPAGGGLKMGAPPILVNLLDMENAIGVKRRNEVNVLKLKKEGVVGIGVGLSDTEPGRVVIEVYVHKPALMVKPLIPETMESVPVKIVETGLFTAH
jgi:hypothetical protein